MVIGSAESSYSSSIEPPNFGPSELTCLGCPVHVRLRVWVWLYVGVGVVVRRCGCGCAGLICLGATLL